MQRKIIITAVLVILVAGFFLIQSRYPLANKVIEITVKVSDHQKRNSPDNSSTDTKPFTRYEGDAFGLDKHNEFSVVDFFSPFVIGRGITSGDFNNDGWQDIILATSNGILVYRNLKTNKFALEDVSMPKINNLGIHIVALVDINNDGWQDIYTTSYGEGKNYFILNNKGKFQNPTFLKVPNTGAIMTESASFGDINKDGDLDFVQGNWFFGSIRGLSSKQGAETNKLIINKGLQFIEESLEEITGPTLAILFSDFNNDNNLDLIVGNDLQQPDVFHVGNGEGGMKEVLNTDNIIPVSAAATMSVDTADFNNDLYMDIYIAGISSSNPKIDGQKNPCSEIKNTEEKQICEQNISIRKIIWTKDLTQCVSLPRGRDKKECLIMVTMLMAWEQKNEALCEKIPQDYKTQKMVCHNFFAPSIELLYYEKSIDQIVENILLEGSKERIFENVAIEKGANEGFWSWTAKFADLDNDEWQDIYIANGFLGRYFDTQSNVFLHNLEGERFVAEQEEFGLRSHNVVNAYTYIDIDNDGDLDIIAVPVNGPLNVYINNETQNNSITFEFRDEKGNHFGIGNKIYVYYGENNERHQVREIKSGGGSLSFDSPIAHFGLGKYDIVSRVEVVWSTGEKTTLDKDFLANKKYVIERK